MSCESDIQPLRECWLELGTTAVPEPLYLDIVSAVLWVHRKRSSKMVKFNTDKPYPNQHTVAELRKDTSILIADQAPTVI